MRISSQATPCLRRLAAATAVLALSGFQAFAHILSITSDVPLTITTPAAGSFVTSDFLITYGLEPGIAFDEVQNFTLPIALPTDTGVVIAAGTVVDSQYLAFNSTDDYVQMTTMTFDGAVLGIEFKDSGDLGLSDLLGLPTLSYNSGCIDCGYEAAEADTAAFAGNTATFNSYFSGPGDFARIITVPPTTVPEPATLALFGTALIVLGTSRGRKPKTA
jgi:PEP-CTERM motif